MSETCRDCENWKASGSIHRNGFLQETGFCQGDAFPLNQPGGLEPRRSTFVRTWWDLPACPHFKERESWEEKAAEEIVHPTPDATWAWMAMGATCSSEVLPKLQKHIASVIRKHYEAAKAGKA